MDLADVTALGTELDGLGSYLLDPAKTQPPDPLADNERRAISAFLVLSHGEVEVFVETCFLDFAKGSLALDENGRVGPGLYQAVVKLSSKLEGQLPGERFTPTSVIEKLPHLIEAQWIKPNNGIKQPNVRQLAQAVGVDWPDLQASCAELIEALHLLGNKRGSVAHAGTSAVVGLREVTYAALRVGVGSALS